ncbi:MAG: hypothetical protein IPH62_11180 [Ignavibacteriae bacterium]|nr:hypothetical protein [Ignavibacteriota bacterium]
MSESRGLDLLDYLVFILKWKKLLISLTIFTIIFSYVTIYFLIDEQFESTSVVITSENENTSGLGSLMKSFSNLPIGIPGLSSSGADTDLFTTIIYSRTNLLKIIDRFDLYKAYKEKTMEETIKVLAGIINAEETKEGAYEIKIRDKSPQKAADMVNYIVKQLNETLIELNIAKAKDNRLFMEKRYEEIKSSLKIAEDSLVIYQKNSGILLAEDQLQASFEAYTKLEAELASKQVEYNILKKLYGENSPQIEAAKISLEEYQIKLNKIKNGKDGSNLILSLTNLPQKSMTYLRFYRDVEIYNAMLEFIIPVYEQSRFDEQKNIPLLQVIDKGIPAEKKAFPQRALLSILITVIVLLMVLFIIIIRELLDKTTNDKVLLIKNEIFKFKKY